MEKKRKSSANLLAKECIVTALLQLIYEKPLSSITISELAARAGVSRMTIYRNYDSKEDIFSTELAEVMEQYREEDARDIQGGTYYDRNHMTHCFAFLYRKREFFEGLLHCGFGQMFLSQLTDFLLDKWGSQYPGRKEQYKLEAFAGALYGLFISWSASRYGEPVGDMVEILNEMYGE